ncbi:Sodium/calcium exchanger protein-domain-containing protein [Phycomyces nitens]|nr:Sodium/calcium exchanger protein-domain-containing protein [Phycomyces nitens]
MLKTHAILIIIFSLVLLASSQETDPQSHNPRQKACINIESHSNQCAFVKDACKGLSGFYLRFYYCTAIWRPFVLITLFSGLLLLFGAVSVASADFFCPNLQSISAKLQLSESLAGVTILAFGNGSSDLFSTFSAMNSGSGSLAIGELIGAGFFIVAVVSGSVGIIRPFTSKRITFMRDAPFLVGATIILGWVVYIERIEWYHGLALILYYVTYVFVVLLSTYHAAATSTLTSPTETSPLLGNSKEPKSFQNKHTRQKHKPPRLHIPDHGFLASTAPDHEPPLGSIIKPISPLPFDQPRDAHISLPISRAPSHSGSFSSQSSARAMAPRVGLRPSLFNAIEFHEQIVSLRRASSSTTLNLFVSPEGSLWSPSPQRSPQPAWNISIDNSPSRNISAADYCLNVSNVHLPHHNDYFSYVSQDTTPAHFGTDYDKENQTDDIHINIQCVPEIRLDPPHPLDDGSTEPKDIYQRSTHGLGLPSPFASISPTLGIPSSPSSEYGWSSPIHVQVIEVPCSDQPTSCKANWEGYFNYALVFDSIMSASQSIQKTLFPTLQFWDSKTTFAKISSLAAAPLVFLFTITLPVVEYNCTQKSSPSVPNSPLSRNIDRNYLSVDNFEPNYVDRDQESDELQKVPWCRWLLALQAITSTTFITAVMAGNGWFKYPHIIWGVILGCVLSGLVLVSTKPNQPPSWHWLLSIPGFIVALHWVFLLVNEMVSMLQALGIIFGISDAIMGLTIFALGNSMGDLVANTAIAEMGFPTMAISACYAGPLLNTVLGVGISSTYQILKTGKAYPLDISPSILISAGGLIVVLLSTIIVTSLNGCRVTRGLGWWMISVYCACCFINMLIEFRVIG